MTAQFILASDSPRRKELLRMLNLSLRVVPSGVEEDYSLPGTPEELVCRFALKKANDVAIRFPERIVLGADTIVVLDGQILGKPVDLPQAKEMLSRLSGQTHTVFTGVAMIKQSQKANHTFCERTTVKFFPLSGEMIDYYVENCGPLDKAGAYAIQDWSACFVESISGCYHNVMGFPVSRFIWVLRRPDINERFGPYNWFGMVEDRS